MKSCNPFPDDKLYNLPKSKSLQTTIFKLNEYDRKFSKRVTNTVGKGEIAR